MPIISLDTGAGDTLTGAGVVHVLDCLFMDIGAFLLPLNLNIFHLSPDPPLSPCLYIE